MADDAKRVTGRKARTGPEKGRAPMHLIDFDDLIRNNDCEYIANFLTEGTLEMDEFMKRDVLDRFLDYVFFKVQTGGVEILNLAYPTKRMLDRDLEKKIMELMNEHLYPEIVYRLLRFFTRNVHDSDSNLYLANLIYSEEIIRAIYETYCMFKKDIFISDPDQRAMNVKRIQQYSPRADSRQSSPLDAAARLKYILEFFLIKNPNLKVYTKEDLLLSRS